MFCGQTFMRIPAASLQSYRPWWIGEKLRQADMSPMQEHPTFSSTHFLYASIASSVHVTDA